MNMKVPARLPPRYKPVVRELHPGDVADDGSIYLGFYSGQDWYVTEKDVLRPDGSNIFLSFNEAASYATTLKAHGHEDWMMPPGDGDLEYPDILNKMYKYKNTRAFKGTYNEDTEDFRTCYWSSTREPGSIVNAWAVRMGNGESGWRSRFMSSCVRCVRGVKRKP